MIALSLLLAAFVLPLVFYRPAPASLRDTHRESLPERLAGSRATLALGIFIIAIALLTFLPGGMKIDRRWAAIFGEREALAIGRGWYFEIVSSNFLHWDIDHLMGNLSVLMLLVVYERRVGWRRYMAVVIVSGMVSSLADLVLLSPNVVSMGASAWICGLGAAYYLDEPELTRREWLVGVVFVLIMTLLLSIPEPKQEATPKYGINWVAHLVGALTGAAYVRLNRKQSFSDDSDLTT